MTETVMIVSGSVPTRNRLKEVLYGDPLFSKLIVAQSVAEATNGLKGPHKKPSLFLIDFELPGIESLIAKVRSFGGFLVLIMKPEDPLSTQMIMSSIGGVIYKPFTGETLNRVKTIYLKLRENPLALQEETILSFVKTVHENLSVASLNQKMNTGGIDPLEILKPIAQEINNLPNNLRGKYYDILIDFLSQLPPPAEIPYNGASSRVRRKVAKQLSSSRIKLTHNETENQNDH